MVAHLAYLFGVELPLLLHPRDKVRVFGASVGLHGYTHARYLAALVSRFLRDGKAAFNSLSFGKPALILLLLIVLELCGILKSAGGGTN